jgi:acyl transferase domain-containing protein
MSARTVLLFPGLGAYSTGVLRQAHAEYPQVADVFQEIDDVAREHGVPSVSAALFGPRPLSIQDIQERPAELLHLAIFGVSVATQRILCDQGLKPYVLVGHSFGEIGALVSAGAFDLADGARLVCARARALEDWEGRGAMAAVSANAEVTGHIIGALDDPELVIACFNAPGQTVISGPAAGLDRAEAVAKALGLFFTRLYLPYASHHPSMRGAVGRFVELTAGLRQRPMEIPVLSPIHGRRYTDEDDLRRALAECLVLPVRFSDTVRGLHERGATTFIEAGALRALTRCVELTVPNVKTVAPLLNPEEEVEQLRRAVAAAQGQSTTARSREREDSARPKPVPATPIGGYARERERRDSLPSTDVTAPEIPPRVPAPAPAELRHAAAPSRRVSSRDEVVGRLRDLYAEALEYPPDALTEGALLEAELGVDSLKQTALLTRAFETFGFPNGAAGLRGLDFPSLGHIADHIVAQSAAQ